MREFKDLMIEKRKDIKMSQYTLARITGLSIQCVRGIEQGDNTNPTLSTVLAITNMLGIDLNLLKDKE